MNIGRYKIRKAIVKMVDLEIDLGEELFKAVGVYYGEKIAEVILTYAEEQHPKHKSYTTCKKCDVTAAYRHAAKIAKSGVAYEPRD